MEYLTLLYPSSHYHSWKLDEKSSNVTTFSWSFDRYNNIRLPFGADQVGKMFQKKIDELFSDMHNILGITNDILIASFDE